MFKVREILDEVFSLMEQQTQTKPDSLSAEEAEDYQKRAERIDQLLNRLMSEGQPGGGKQLPHD